jgi:hypothetical protein
MNHAIKASVTGVAIALGMFFSGLSVWGQSSSPASAGISSGQESQTIRLYVLLVGIDKVDEGEHGLSRRTASRSLDRVARAMESLKVPGKADVFLERLSGKEATAANVEKTWETLQTRTSDNDLIILYYLGAIFFADNDAGSGLWKLAVAETLDEDEAKPAQGLSLEKLSELLRKTSSRRTVCFLDVLAWKSEGANAHEAAGKLADTVAREKAAAIVVAALSGTHLESPTAMESFSAQGLSYAIEAREADALPSGDTDGFITVSEVTGRMISFIKSQWDAEDPAMQRSEVIRGLPSQPWKMGVIPERRAQLHEWRVQLGEKWGDKSVDSRLLLEAIRILEGEESVESIPPHLRGALITLIGRYNQGDFSRAEYPLQRSIVLGIPFADTQEPIDRQGDSFWKALPIAPRIAFIIIPVALLVYLLARFLLHRHGVVVLDETTESAPARGGSSGKSAAPGAAANSKSARGQPAIRPVGSPVAPSGGSSRAAGGVGSISLSAPQRVAPTPPSSIRRVGGGEPPSPPKVSSVPAAVPAPPPRIEEEVVAPPSLAELRARAVAEQPLVGEIDAELDIMLDMRESQAHPPAPAASTPPPPQPPQPICQQTSAMESAPPLVDLDLDVELVRDQNPSVPQPLSKEMTPPKPLPALPVSTPPGPLTPLPVKSAPGFAPPTPSPVRPTLGGKPVSGDATQPPSARILVKPGTPPPPKSDSRLPAISPGVLPAVIRAWDLEWMGPMARSRFRLLCGGHLELGRPAGLQTPSDSSLFISLLPVGENGKPNASLLAMLSRQALAVDLRGDGAKLTVQNKASVHMSPDPLRPYWDWDNPMPGAERIIALGETLWVSPHFGKILAPISIRTLTTAGSTACSCAVEMHFDAVFFDLVAICIILMDENFEMVWGPPPQGQIVPNIGEGPEPLLRTQITPRGLVVKPLQNGVWTRRQGAMVDEESLLLGGVSAVEWKTERGDYSLKLTPHALPGPRIGRPMEPAK